MKFIGKNFEIYFDRGEFVLGQRKLRFTYKIAYYLVLAMVLLSFVPLLFISKYNHMSADDYAYGSNAHAVWEETGSLTETIKTAGATVVDYYGRWQGTFSSIFLMALQPGVFGEQYYPVGAVFLICLFAVSFYIFGHVMLTRLLGVDIYQAGIVTLLMLLVCTQWMQDPVQAFYFYNAGVHYIFMFSMVLLALSLQVLVITGTKRRIVYTVIASLLAFIIGGGNYVTAFFYLLLYVTILAVIFFLEWVKKRKKSAVLLQIIPLITLVCSFLISVMAPGNTVRGDKFEDITPVGAIGLAFQYSIEGCNVWMTLSIVCVFLFMLPLVVAMVQKTDFTFPLPGLVVIYAYCLFAAMYAPTCYALGFPGAGRCRNIYRMVYYLMLLFDMIYVCGYVSCKLKKSGFYEAVKKAFDYFKKRIWISYGAVILAFLLLIVLTDDWNSYASLSAVKSVWAKEAQLYHVQSLEREEMLRTTKEKKVEVQSTTAHPHLLFFDDITTDSSDWRNKNMAKWYGKKKVVLVERK